MEALFLFFILFFIRYLLNFQMNQLFIYYDTLFYFF